MYQKIFKIYTVPKKMLNKVKENKLLKIEELKAKEGNEIAKKIEEENKTGKVKKKTIKTEKIIKRVRAWTDLFEMQNYEYRKGKICKI